jgi:tRNA synthetases class I (I, L, M and V)
MPFASQHYPFENVDKFKSSFPGDLIAEGLDQTRADGSTRHSSSGTQLFGVAPFNMELIKGARHSGCLSKGVTQELPPETRRSLYPYETILMALRAGRRGAMP